MIGAVTPFPPLEQEALFATWAQLQFIAEEVAEFFFAQMFALDQRYRRLYEHVPPERRHQVLMGALAACVADERHPWFRCDAGFRRWGLALARAGLTAVDYDRAGRVLLSSLAVTLGESFSPAARAAWTALLGRVADALALVVEPGSGRPPGSAS